MRRISSGIRRFDNAIQGGFPVGISVLLVGMPMTGKTTLAMQFIYNGLVSGDAGIFISTNATAEDVKERMASFGWDTTPYEERGLMKFVDCYGMMVDSKLSDTRSIKRIPSILAFTSLSVALSEICGHFWRLQKIPRVIFDSISSLLMYANPDAVIRFLHVLLGRLKLVNAVSILILEEGMHDRTLEITLQQLTDGALRLIRKDAERAILCLGLASTKCTEREIPFTITDKGVIINP
ncbi:hypothetical protein CW706_02565 [Candidatus Bathyarchaeota archaeon]|nr:MAG: hypothetical protein CW706_02565 [Candidatus Bathyarchaeota archaeon]